MHASEYIPAWLLASGQRGMAMWQWLAVPAVLAVAALVGAALERVGRAVVRLLARRARPDGQHPWIDLAVGPARWLWGMGVAYLLFTALRLPDNVQHLVDSVLRTAAFAAFFWILLRLVSLAGVHVQASPWATTHPGLRSLVPLGVRIGRIAVAAIAIVAVLAELGYAVTSLLAGLGIGGLAVALAGQKTVENLFGAFSIGVDQPFTVGDTIRVDTIEGVVEAIGLRSTRIRTAERTLITMPNGKLADLRVETMSARDRLRLSCVLALVHGTSAAQLRAVLTGVEGLLRGNPKTRQEDVVVCFRALGEQALEVEVMATFATTDWAEFRSLREQMLLGIIEAVEKAGTRFAFPTRTVHLLERPRA